IIAGLSTFLLLRRLSLGRWASGAGAIAFALNGTFAWLSHAPVNPVALLPALLLGVELAYTASRAGRRGGWWLIAVAAAGSFYAGFPEITYIGGLLGICCSRGVAAASAASACERLRARPPAAR